MISTLDDHAFAITAYDGLRVSAIRTGTASAPASVVYVHGMLTNAGYWLPLISHLHRHLDGGIAQIRYDQRGHGHSDPVTSRTRLSLRTLVEDPDRALDHVHGSIVLVAHSVASLLIQEWVSRDPHRARDLAGIVLFNGCREFPYAPATSNEVIPEPHQRLGRHTMCEQLGRYLYMAPQRGRWSRRRPRTSALAETFQRLHEPIETTMADLAAYPRAILSAEAINALRGIPTWVQTGQLDPVVAPRCSRQLAEQIWAEYDTVPGAGHSLPHVHPDRASEPILAALEVAYRTHRLTGGVS
ncbi:alpha/beta fold hydrolase [Nocardia brasiliensis]|uniref:alpha/beta fold hydrolase n=1 Tax=Nocardia brasiliensis TaxID=37326 RepID=UPI0024580741|nr:alpha/beta hydrolase [Nocardia brasiliensis]